MEVPRPENETERLKALRYQKALLELAKMDNSDLDLTLRVITELDSKTLGVEQVSVWFFNEDRSEFICKDLYKLSEDRHENGFRFLTRDYPDYFHALEESRILAASDACNDPRTSQFSDGYLKPFGISSIMDVPIRLHSRIVGIVCHEHTGPKREWAIEEQDFGASIADMVSLALEASERRRLEEALRRAYDDLEVRVEERTAALAKANEALQNEINERKSAEDALKDSLNLLAKKNRYETIIGIVSRSVHQSIGLQEVLENAIEAISKNIERVDNIFISLVEGDEAVLKACRGYPDWFIERVRRIPYPKGATWKTIISGRPTYCADAENDTVLGPAGKEVGTKSYLSIPIRGGDRTIGVININSLKKNAFDEDELKLFEIIAQQIEAAINNAKQAEALRQSEERYRTLFDQSPIGVYIFDKEFKITHCNERMADILKSSRERIIGVDMRKLKDQGFMSLMRKALEGITSQQEGFYEATTSSAKLWLSVRVAPLRDAEGGVTSGMAVVEDITERKRSEEALLSIAKGVSAETGEAFFRLMVENLAKALEADCAFIAEMVEGGVERVRTIAVCTDGEIIGNFEYDLAHTPFEDVVGRGLISYTEGVRRGFPRDYMLAEMGIEGYVGAPLFDSAGRILGLMVVLYRQPIRNPRIAESMLQIFAVRASAELERRKAEKALKESEMQLRLALSAARMGTWNWDIVTGKVNWSEGVEPLFGLPPGSFSGSYAAYLDCLYPQDREVVKQAIARAINGGEDYYVEHRIVWPDGSIRWLGCKGNVLRDENGRAIRMDGTVMDITERKRAEEDLIRAQKLESLGVLAGGIAHDFNNLLTVILGNVSLVKTYGNPEDKAYRRLTEAEKACLRARDLTQQLLTFSKGGAPVKKVTSIAELIRESASFAQRGSNVRCEFSIADGLWPLEVDEGQISQVINNLVINAQQAMPQGGVIRISVENVMGTGFPISDRVGALQVKDRRYVKITVEDQGIGIPEEHVSKVFDPYFTTKQRGSGLGLAVTYSIVKNHDGYIEVESKLGVGTKFHIYLPVCDKGLPERTNMEKDNLIRGRGRVLVMDDEEIVRDLLGEILGQIGYEVGFAREGGEAIELYIRAKDSGKPFDVVIMDLTVPGGMGGKETIKRLLDIDPEIKAIVSSGYSNDPIMSDYRRYGFMEMVTKPYRIEELSVVLNKVMNGK